MRGIRKFIFGLYSVAAYIFGCWLTKISVEGGIIVTLTLITIGGNVAEHIANGRKP